MGNLFSCGGSGPALQTAVASGDAAEIAQVRLCRRQGRSPGPDSTAWPIGPARVHPASVCGPPARAERAGLAAQILRARPEAVFYQPQKHGQDHRGAGSGCAGGSAVCTGHQTSHARAAALAFALSWA